MNKMCDTLEKNDREPECENCGKECTSPEFTDLNYERDWIAINDNPYTEFPTLTKQREEAMETQLDNNPFLHTRLYIFADQFEVPSLRQDIIDSLWHWHVTNTNHVASWSVLVVSTTNLPLKSPLSRFWIDLMMERYHDIYGASQLCSIEWTYVSMVPNQVLICHNGWPFESE